MASILLEIGNKYTDEREKQFYLQGQNDIPTAFTNYTLFMYMI
jgi:hypothetical protein